MSINKYVPVHLSTDRHQILLYSYVYLIQHYVIKFVSDVRQVGQWFSLCTPVSSTNKADCHDITEILLKVALNTITLTPYNYNQYKMYIQYFYYLYEGIHIFIRLLDVKSLLVRSVLCRAKCNRQWSNTDHLIIIINQCITKTFGED